MYALCRVDSDQVKPQEEVFLHGQGQGRPRKGWYVGHTTVAPGLALQKAETQSNSVARRCFMLSAM